MVPCCHVQEGLGETTTETVAAERAPTMRCLMIRWTRTNNAYQPGIRRFRGHRQRLDRYDDVDFADQRSTLQELGLWLQDV